MAVSPASFAFHYRGVFLCALSLTCGLTSLKNATQFEAEISARISKRHEPWVVR